MLYASHVPANLVTHVDGGVERDLAAGRVIFMGEVADEVDRARGGAEVERERAARISTVALCRGGERQEG